MGEFYDGTKLLSMLDINGKKPELYISTTNRSAGKTTFFGRYFVNRFLLHNEKFMLLYRYSYEMDNCSEAFFKDIGSLFFKNHKMENKSVSKGMYHELFIDDKPCGYAVAINGADKVKKRSHVFNDVTRILFDEFQSETNAYCPDEVNKFLSIHKSVARGQNQQRRYVPVFMLSNLISLLNPYYIELGISERLTKATKYLKGNGFVLEQGFNESASNAEKTSGIYQAFSSNVYSKSNTEMFYLNDNSNFIEKISGSSKYIATLKYNNKLFSLKEYSENSIIYCDTSVDETYPIKICIDTADHSLNYVMLQRNNLFIQQMRLLFERGCFRFKNLECKTCVYKLLSY